MSLHSCALRAFSITLVILFCFSILVIGIGESYENTVRIGFGEYKSAIEITNRYIRILDFKIMIKADAAQATSAFFI